MLMTNTLSFISLETCESRSARKFFHICSKMKSKAHLTQWKNSDSVINWFEQLNNKEKLHFIQFDVVNFYGSISLDLLENSFTFAARFTHISEKEKSTIRQAANSYLFSSNQAWIKRNGGTFDVTMGGYHGAEICDLVGLFILSQLVEVIPSPFIGLYRDDGLAVSPATKRQTEIMKKKICDIFKKNNLQITTEANLKEVNFQSVMMWTLLDVRMSPDVSQRVLCAMASTSV